MQLPRAARWLFFAFLAPLAGAEGWQLKRDRHGVEVHSRPLPSGYIEVRASITLDVPLMALPLLLDDTERACQWIAHCRQVVIAQASDDGARLVHSIFNAPWPVTDRDMVTRSILSVSNTPHPQLTISIVDDPGAIEASDQFVRIAPVRGQWTAVQTPSGQAHITYQGYAEPGGALPKWLANRLTLSSTYDTMRGLQRMLPAVMVTHQTPVEITD